MISSRAEPTVSLLARGRRLRRGEAADGPAVFWRRHLLAPAAAALAAALLFELSWLDQRLASRFFYDRATGRWLGADAWWANELIHDAGRKAIGLVFVAAVLLFSASFLIARARSWRRPAAYLALVIALAPGLVAALKSTTDVDCPWSLSEFGGSRPYVRLLADRPNELPAAACFPGGHSSGGFALLGLYFVWRERNRTIARAGLALGIAAGTTFAFGQWSRGAHFASHDVASAFLCWFVVLAVYAVAFQRRLWPRVTP